MSFNPEIDYNAVLLDQEFIKRLNMLLIPTDALQRDVRLVAGLLGFTTDEVAYVSSKNYAFVYMYDQWIKREGREAKLMVLHKIFCDIKRMDAAEIIEQSIKELHDRDPKEIMKIEERFFSTLQRSISCTTLYQPGTDTSSIEFEQKRNAARPGGDQARFVPSLLQPSLIIQNGNKAPDVFVVYYPENDKHVNNVVKFIKRLRKKGIDATCDMFESKSEDRGFYMYSKLVESDYVFVVCSNKFYEYCNLKPGQEMDEQGKEISFIMTLILSGIYDNGGRNAKYIPILFAHATGDHVPTVLRCSTIYKMPYDFDDLKRRLFKVEKYKLAPMPAKRPQIKPKIIGSGNGKLRAWMMMLFA